MRFNYRHLDWKLVGAVMALSLIGIITIFSSQYYSNSAYQQTYWLRQLVWLVLAFVAFLAVVRFPQRLFDASAYGLYGVSLVLLILVLAVGHTRMGASRWFDLGPVSFSPSDIAKLAALLTIARFFAYTRLPAYSKRRLAVSAIIVILPMMLILKQPDLGTSLTFPVILFALWFWSGLSPWYLVLIVSPIISMVAAYYWLSWAVYLVALLIFLASLRPGLIFSIGVVVMNLAFGMITPFIWERLADYQKNRILTFLNPGHDPRGAGYQIIQSKIAIGSGGVIGKGYLQGSQARLDYLPERHTDFIFSVLGEEFGLIGALIVIGLFTFIFFRCIRIAARCRSRFASYTCFGATAVLFFQFAVNIGMTLGLMPVTGLPLPFVSYGGTGLLLSWVLIGLIVAADHHWQEY
ncbi:rod shape-determining protein RodA [candidate division GN15 bacterium]|uniref:Peptidoglycan glycosyltransferase RodA n=1 Tax=candidate division GN15 bacterium TaxID=2072418 RepID=A0A855WUM4_9BACT|nr:MAG: rod shape-determining protein RodA [candidate division GN15 bacterium]